jgi:N utilization substance protein B
VFVLYQQDLLGLAAGPALQRVDDAELDQYARALVLGVAGEVGAIDEVLERHVAGWSLERLGTLERSILRLATFELLWEAGVPVAVAINEAVELAKRFCTDEAGALVNGILGSIAISEQERIREIRQDQEKGFKVTA